MITSAKIKFKVVTDAKLDTSVSNMAYLIVDRWDDWSKYATMYTLVFIPEAGKEVTIGSVKIGQKGLKPSGVMSQTAGAKERRPQIPDEFDGLGEEFFSIGQNENYYETINSFSEEARAYLLSGLRDCAFNLHIFDENLSEEVMGTSLLRSVSVDNIRGRYHRLALGNAQLTPYHFVYSYDQFGNQQDRISLEYQVTPNSFPPSNVNVIIGRNGVGKTRCFSTMVNTLLKRPQDDLPVGEMKFIGNDSFSSLISVSFSAFDDFDPPMSGQEREGILYHYIGLKGKDANGNNITKNTSDLIDEFVHSSTNCRMGLRENRWRKGLEALESDPVFEFAGISDWCFSSEADRADSFRRLSSGHKIVLLTITRLVELVEEKTLVLLDEPEGHLHPPLLSALVRALSDLLVQKNGVALVATHSPVVLQEVPKKCAWILHRYGASAKAERPQIETFGENIGVLTREVFGLEVLRSGFHKLLEDKIKAGHDLAQILQESNGELGSDAKTLIVSLSMNKEVDGAD